MTQDELIETLDEIGDQDDIEIKIGRFSFVYDFFSDEGRKIKNVVTKSLKKNMEPNPEVDEVLKDIFNHKIINVFEE